MPIWDFECGLCGRIEENVFQKFEDPAPICRGETVVEKEGSLEAVADTHDPITMERLIGEVLFKKGKGHWPDKERQERRARFKRRNQRIEKMTPGQQAGFKHIIDSANGDRYIP